jgi:transcriptional regulator with XRE-family HTH domain
MSSDRKTSASTFAGVLAAGRRSLHLTQAQLGERLGVSGETVYRWERRKRSPGPREVPDLIRRLSLLSPELAAKAAAAMGTTLEAAGAAPPAPVSVVAQRHSLEAAICAAAEALDMSPRLVRPAAAALLARLAEARLSIDEAASLAKE